MNFNLALQDTPLEIVLKKSGAKLHYEMDIDGNDLDSDDDHADDDDVDNLETGTAPDSDVELVEPHSSKISTHRQKEMVAAVPNQSFKRVRIQNHGKPVEAIQNDYKPKIKQSNGWMKKK